MVWFADQREAASSEVVDQYFTLKDRLSKLNALLPILAFGDQQTVLEVGRQALMGEELTKNHGFIMGSKSNEEEEEEEEVEKAMRQM
ncbi:uncharacterized protein A4U43_C07F10480 [Asparagus officinalis]|uniref:Uncharacterized protein n=1 Tax=Asparagus officinalis TaxID=4686 RepID=A0A5P1EB72_ASPOF|nr:uncharacterized protein A4U43_C07F10480 [Asparagus officinalis]